MIYIVSGPSGCGKSTLIRRVLGEVEDVRFSVSHTTREKRGTEVEGKDYHFVSRAFFRRMIQGNRLVEWALVHGEYYGTSRKELAGAQRHDIILDIDVQGARQIRRKLPSAVLIFVLPPSYRELRKRIKARGLDKAEAVRARMITARKEVKAYSLFDYIVVNDDLDSAAVELGAILRCRRALRSVRERAVRPILKNFRGKG
ncbi:MAG: guanylate kinase [Candidatus Aminicenantes bacterium]|nr:guanylate kinase [Candidatus Aminicenantes bacterium]